MKDKLATQKMVIDMALVADGREPLANADTEKLIRSFSRQSKAATVGLFLFDVIGTMVLGGLIGLMFGLPVLFTGIALFLVRHAINFNARPIAMFLQMFFAARLLIKAKAKAKKVGAPYMGFGGGDHDVPMADLQKILSSTKN